MRFEFTSSRKLSGTCLVAGLMLSACLGTPPTATTGGAPEPDKPTRPVRIDAATPFPILTHATLRPGTPRPSPSAAPSGAVPASDAPAESPAATTPASLSEILKATALASASPLPAEDAAAVAEALADEEVVVLLPADLIHDGGTALYRLATVDGAAMDDTAASPPAETPATASPATASPATASPDAENPDEETPAASPPARSPRPSNRPAAAEPPAEWGRQQVAVGKREAATARGARKDEAGAAIGSLNRGTFAFKPADGGETMRKPFIEVFRRQVGLKKGKAAWHPTALGPMRFETQGGQSGLEVVRLKLDSPDDVSIGFEIGATDVLTPIADLPHATAGGKLRLEAEVRDRLPGELFVYGRLVGAGAAQRVLLRDDGAGADRKAGDGIYAWELKAPTAAGFHHLAIDVLDARCFQAKGPVRSLAVGFTFEVKP